MAGENYATVDKFRLELDQNWLGFTPVVVIQNRRPMLMTAMGGKRSLCRAKIFLSYRHRTMPAQVSPESSGRGFFSF
jgi:hypothetical protein